MGLLRHTVDPPFPPFLSEHLCGRRLSLGFAFRFLVSKTHATSSIAKIIRIYTI
jgi:hypothetical protein